MILRQEYIYRPLPLHICTVGRFNSIAAMALNVVGVGGQAATAWPANNRAIYTPFDLPIPFTIARFMIANGTSSGNRDIGIYDSNFSRLLSTGSTASSGTNAVQYIGVADQVFAAGRYYLGLVCSTTVATVNAVSLSTAALARACGLLEEDLGATTLPAIATPVAYTGTVAFRYGFSQSDSL
jgi:hypothetical protein